jgi:hypothetical protein
VINRRNLLAQSSIIAALSMAGCASVVPGKGQFSSKQPSALSPFFEELEERTFRYFWDLVNRKNGLVPDRWPTLSFASIAAIGFALTAYPVGVDRGWCTRAEASEITVRTLRFFWNAPQGANTTGTTGYKGFFYHFLDMENGLRYKNVELSTIDSTLLFLGMLFAAEYFDRDDAVEQEIRKLAIDIVDRADWRWFQTESVAIPMGWHPETGFIERKWDGYNEGTMVYILALGSAGHPVPDGAWAEWTKPYPAFWRGQGDTRHLAFAPLFGHQYSQTWIDFRGIRDDVMRAEGFDYFENSRRATYANRAYCIANPMKWEGYSKDIWGLTACDGPGNFKQRYKGEDREFFGYAARGPLGQPDERDDGTLAATASLGSMPFAPEICIPAAEALREFQGGRLWSKYGFVDSFNPSFTYEVSPLEIGHVDSKLGWVGGDYIGIDQGPILCQLANFRNDFVWKYMRRSATIRRGLLRAGFTGGWLTA